jgi:hypothetical protein
VERTVQIKGLSEEELRRFGEGQLRGAPIKGAISWIRDTYGDELYTRALASCGPPIEAMFSREIFAGTLYPVRAWDEALDAVRREVKAKTGEDEATFDHRNVFESGNRVLISVYSFLLNFVDPTKVVNKLHALWSRLYPDCVVNVVTNEAGHCVAELQGPVAYRTNAKHHFRPGLELVLHMGKAKDVTAKTITDSEENGRFLLRVEARYAK